MNTRTDPGPPPGPAPLARRPRTSHAGWLAASLASLACVSLAAPAPALPGTDAPTVRRLVLLSGEPLAELHLRHASPHAIQAARHGLLSNQDHLARSVEALGGKVLLSWQLLVHGAWVEVPAPAAESLAAIEGVARVFAEHHHAPATATSVPFVRAPQAWSGPAGPTGRGRRIGVIDSGIDYLHAHLGGAGSQALYLANDPAVLEPGSFPTPKVAGGTDLVGDDYDASSSSTSTPRPDPDPLDPSANGHGSHVAGIAAGIGLLPDGSPFPGPYDASAATTRWRIGPGVAPEATLHAIKVFGRGGLTSSAIVVQALEVAADPDRNGDPSDHLDVANLSLGSPFGIDDPDEPQAAAIRRLSALGCVVVLSAGNGGNTAFKVDSPASAEAAIAVANAYDDGFDTGAISLDAPASLAGRIASVEGQFTPPLSTLPPISGRLVRVLPNLACDPIQNAAELRGQVALVDRGTCFFLDKVRALQAAGARAVVVVNNVDGPPLVMGASGPTSDITIPAVMVGRADGDRIKARLAEGVTVTLDAQVRLGLPELADTLNESSSRGPVGRGGRLKPDVSAPGTAIASAGAGSGNAAEPMTGTSMAAPHVAGAAALVRQARPQWPARDIKAALMNTAASPMRGSNGPAFPESRAGAGRLDVARALQTPLVALSTAQPDAVSLSFGLVLADQPVTRTQSVTVINHSPSPVTLRAESLPTLDQPGARLVTPSDPVVVPPMGAAEFPVHLVVEPALLVPDADRASAAQALGRPRLGLPEASGQVWLRGGPVDLHVPWHALVRAVGRPRALAPLSGVAPGDPAVAPIPTTTPPVPADGGWVAVFQRGFLNTNVNAIGDGLATDLVAAGAASDAATSGGIASASLSFAVVTAGPWPSPSRAFTRVDVEIDRDGNGTVDAVLSNGDTGLVQANDLSDEKASTDAHVSVARVGAGALVAAGGWNRLPPDIADPAAFANGAMVLSATGSELGLTSATAALRYRVRTDGAFADSTPWILFHPARPLVDGTATQRPGGLWQREGRAVAALVRRSNATANGIATTGRAQALLVHLHAMPGTQAEAVALDLAQPDVDADGLPDAWELAWVGDLAASPGTDRDGDGLADGGEWQAGTDPLARDGFVGGGPATGGVVLRWTGTPGRRFAILRSDSVQGPYAPWRTGLTAAEGVQEVMDTDASPPDGARFYRLQVAP